MNRSKYFSNSVSVITRLKRVQVFHFTKIVRFLKFFDSVSKFSMSRGNQRLNQNEMIIFHRFELNVITIPSFHTKCRRGFMYSADRKQFEIIENNYF